MLKDLNKKLPIPCVEEVKKYLKQWEEDEVYFNSEKSLNKLFLQTYPQNTNLEDIIIKVCALDVVYSANAGRWFFELSRNIKGQNIDHLLMRSESIAVDKIASGHGIKTKRDKEKRFYSFATKYCSHHKPNDYPIYDSYVEKVLNYFKKEDKFTDFLSQSLKDYTTFKEVILEFRKYYKLSDFSLKEVDIYLWLLGKEYFPNSYKKKKDADN